MKKILSSLLMLVLCCAMSAGELSRLRVVGNKFLNEEGQAVVLRGLCFSDPVKLVGDGHWTEEYFAQAAAWKANVVRFAVHPQNINRMGWDETFRAIDQGIEWAKKYGMYVIIDWHSIGNLKDRRFTAEMYKTDMQETLRFWRMVATRYNDEPTVALYELFNEPTVTGEELGTCTWQEWRRIQETIIDAIRDINPRAICLCAGFNWAYDLTPVATAPIRRGNIAYVAHPYPMKRDQPWEEQWEKDYGYVADEYPVVCTEIGFCLADEKGAHIPVMSTEVYGETITKYFEKKGISFTAWCFDPDWAPMLFSDWDYTPTTQGRFFKAYLQQANGPQSQIVEEGGTGKYKAVMTEVESLPAHTVFMPQDLKPFGKKNPLPVLVWGNGACRNSPWEHYKFLNEIASHGYLVIATGYFSKDGQPIEGPMSTPQQQIESIDWAIAQNADPTSPLYGKVNTKAICASGMSCGGLQTLFNCADKRITTYMICNSGLFIDPSIAMPNMPMPGKEQLKSVHGPVMYLLGGPMDIAYQNGMDDFHRIDHVPAVAVNFPVGHGGTYGQPYGGEFRFPAIAWLDWQLKGNAQAAKMFKGKHPQILDRKDWTIEKNALMK